MSTCSKTPYQTQWLAELTLKKVRQLNASRGKKCPTGTYFCASCRAFHLTSKSVSQKPPWDR